MILMHGSYGPLYDSHNSYRSVMDFYASLLILTYPVYPYVLLSNPMVFISMCVERAYARHLLSIAYGSTCLAYGIICRHMLAHASTR